MFNKAWYLRAPRFSRGLVPHLLSETEMLSIHGTAMQRLSALRAASGCPSITGSRSRPVAKDHRDFVIELER
jgi:hypothetical protein